jgi:hypothetical protein
LRAITVKDNQEDAERRLAMLLNTRRHAEKARIVAPRLSEFTETIKRDADLLTFDQKRQLLRAFETQITAVTGSYQVTCLIEAEIKIDETKDAWYAERVKELEAKYPDMTVIDLLNQTGVPAEDSSYGQALITFNQNLVTIEQTLTCPPKTIPVSC